MNGADWKTIGWVEYQTMLEAWNAASATEGDKPAPDLTRLRRSLAAHTKH
jgi:hypothetical protein